MRGTEWTVEQVASITDGDSLRVYRSRVAQLGDDWYRITDVNPDGTPRSVPIRLVWVDTPERGKLFYREARDHLESWINHRGYDENGDITLRVICYESAGWDRLLGDLIDAEGNSSSQWMMAEKGWPPYRRTAQGETQ